MADGNTLTLTLSTGGDVVIKLRPDLARLSSVSPTCEDGFYDGWCFTGDPRLHCPAGTAPDRDWRQRQAGPQAVFKERTSRCCSMARSSAPTAPIVVRLCFADSKFLNGQIPWWGHFESGMDHVTRFRRRPFSSGSIVKARSPDAVITLITARPPAGADFAGNLRPGREAGAGGAAEGGASSAASDLAMPAVAIDLRARKRGGLSRIPRLTASMSGTLSQGKLWTLGRFAALDAPAGSIIDLNCGTLVDLPTRAGRISNAAMARS